MMAAGAFTQAQSSLRWFIDNFSAIADWRATLLRVAILPPCARIDARAARLREPDRLTPKASPASLRSRICRSSRRPMPTGSRRRMRDRAPARACLILARPGPARRSCSGRSRALAVGLRTDHASARRADLLPAARHALSAARHAARGARLSVEAGELRRQCLHPGSLPARRRAIGADARRDSSVGSGAEPGRATVSRVRAHPDPGAALGLDRRYARIAR